MIYIRWLGAAGIELKINDNIFLIDPYFSRISLFKSIFYKLKPNHKLIKKYITQCDYLFITHSHFDHIMDAADIIENTSCKVYCSNNSCSILKSLNIKEKFLTEINYQDELHLDSVTVNVLEAEHIKLPDINTKKSINNVNPPLKAKDYHMDFNFSYLFSIINKIKILIGNNKYKNNNPTPCDILVTSPFYSYDYYEKIINILKPKIIIPNHWDNFFRPLTKKIKGFKITIQNKFPYIKPYNLKKFENIIKTISKEIIIYKLEIFRYYDIIKLLNSDMNI